MAEPQIQTKAIDPLTRTVELDLQSGRSGLGIEPVSDLCASHREVQHVLGILLSEVLPCQQPGTKAQPSIPNIHTELPQTGQELLLDLAGHAGLLRARVTRRVGVGVGRKGAILMGLLGGAQAGAHALVQRAEALDHLGWRAAIAGPAQVLLHREQ